MHKTYGNDFTSNDKSSLSYSSLIISSEVTEFVLVDLPLSDIFSIFFDYMKGEFSDLSRNLTYLL